MHRRTKLPKSKRKNKANRILRPDEKIKAKEIIPLRLSYYERFFASLLRSEGGEYLCQGNQARQTLLTICDRLNLPTPTKALQASYNTQKEHFSSRAALVMEEARQCISDGLQLLQNDFKNTERRNERTNSRLEPLNLIPMNLSMVGVDQKGTGHTLVTFSKGKLPFTRDELLGLRHGTVVACLDQTLSPTIKNIILGTVIPQNREELVSSNDFVVMFFFKMKKKIDINEWKVIPIASLLSEQRKFEACCKLMDNPVSFLLPLLGRKRPTHIRCIETNESDLKDSNSKAMCFDDNYTNFSNDCEVLEVVKVDDTFKVPRLNEMQEKAAIAFLGSKSDTITLVQGPPGTGKTTLLTSVICRYIIQSRKLKHSKRCLLVTAPTNKAVMVLFKRFLNTFCDSTTITTPTTNNISNVILLGDEDKLFENNNRNVIDDGYRACRENFLYTFIDTIKEDYMYIRKILDNGNYGLLRRVEHVARRLENRLSQKLNGKKEVLLTARKIAKLIAALSSSRSKNYPVEVINLIDLLLGTINSWNHDAIYQETLRASDVIFCTLGSTGSSFLKKAVGEVDDLIVDEGAAATEPELYIPFQYLPRRLLCVGDPLQLPATIKSRFAESMGLSKSLQERLMFDCRYDHIMLETQYRMRPELSQFPSRHFYDGKLINGCNVVREKYQSGISIMGCPNYAFYQVTDGIERYVRSGSIENEAEANAVVEIVDNLRRVSRNSPDWFSANRVRIITFYQAQVLLIRRLLRKRNLGNVCVATVDSSQGCEADLVVLSFVRSERSSGRKCNSVGFLTDSRRLNVAMTRAKYQIIGVGNMHRMANLTDEKALSVKCLAIDAINRNSVLPFPSVGFTSNRKRKSQQRRLENRQCRPTDFITTNRRSKKVFSKNTNIESRNVSQKKIDKSTETLRSINNSSTSESTTTMNQKVEDCTTILDTDRTMASIEGQQKQNQLQSSELSKAETMAVFEDFSF